MIVLDSTLKSLELSLSGSVSTTQLDWVCSYVDVLTPTTAPTGFTSGETDGVSNNATAVVVLAAPASTHQRQVKFLSVQNVDTAAATVLIKYNNNGTKRLVYKATLSVGYTLTYTDGDGWRVWDTTGALLTAVGPQTVALMAQVTLTNAQILAWPGTTYDLVTAVPNYRIQPTWIDLHITIATGGDYGTIDADAFTDVALGVNTGLMSYLDNDSTATTTDLTTFLTGGPCQNRALIVPIIPIIAGTTNYLGALVRGSDEEGLTLNITMDNGGPVAFSGGNAANSLVITTFYSLIP
jgi:hypothetical protein